MSTSAVNRNKKAHDAREQQKKQVAELKKKQNEEINKLQKSHGQKVRELQKTHETQLEGVRQRGQEALSDKDRKYQNEIDKVKSAHVQQTKNSAQNYDRQIRQIQDSHESEVNKQQEVHETQQQSLSKNYETYSKNKEENFNKAVKEMHESQEEALFKQRERIESKYSKDNNDLRKIQDKKINELTNQLQLTREQKNAEIKDLKVENLSDKQQSNADKLSLLTQERKTQEMHKGNMREQYDKNLENLRDKYGQYNQESRSGRAQELQNMKRIAEERNRNQVGSLERRIRELNSDHDNDRFLAQKQFYEEKKNYLNATKEALAKAEMLRTKVYDSANEKTSSEIKDIVNRNAETMDRQSKYYKDRINTMDLKYGESVENQVKSLEVENQQDRRKAESRQQKLNYLMSKDKTEMESYYKELLNEKDRVHKDTMVDQRMALLKERNEAVSKLEGRMREMDAKNTEKMNHLIQRYEREVGHMKEEHKAEKKRMADQHNRRIDELEKSHKFLMDSEKVQAKNSETQMKERYERALTQMEVKHDEERVRMASIKRS
jgi:hypothetical protein